MDELLQIPGIGPKMAPKLRRLGFDRVADLKNADPEDMYRRYEELVGGPADRCVLYVFRCAVYFARTPDPDLGLLRWWRWKDLRLEDLTACEGLPEVSRSAHSEVPAE
ncbi:MAG: Pathogenicity locus [Acidobacteria bacterium]|nr:Pathogenicity locus [Acidobacteriota bacterium]